MAITATKLESFVLGNKRCELWNVVGSSDTGGTFTAGVKPVAVLPSGGTGTYPTALLLSYNATTKVVTLSYTSGSPTVRLLVMGS